MRPETVGCLARWSPYARVRTYDISGSWVPRKLSRTHCRPSSKTLKSASTTSRPSQGGNLMLISWYSYNQTGGTTEGTRDVGMARPDRDWSEPHIHVNGIDEVLADLARYTPLLKVLPRRREEKPVHESQRLTTAILKPGVCFSSTRILANHCFWTLCGSHSLHLDP